MVMEVVQVADFRGEGGGFDAAQISHYDLSEFDIEFELDEESRHLI